MISDEYSDALEKICLSPSSLELNDIEQNFLPAIAQRLYHEVDVGERCGFTILHCDRNMMQTRSEVAHKGHGRRLGQQAIHEIRMIGRGEYFGRTVELILIMNAFGHVGRGILVSNIV
jgi:hypothetical protein